MSPFFYSNFGDLCLIYTRWFFLFSVRFALFMLFIFEVWLCKK